MEFSAVFSPFHWSQGGGDTFYKFCIQLILNALTVEKVTRSFLLKETTTELGYFFINRSEQRMTKIPVFVFILSAFLDRMY